MGAPDYRIVAGLSVQPSFDPQDRDSDGDDVPDGLDRCLDEAEDYDGFQDDDGCPELDNDVDGIPDANDDCPMDPEDDDGWLDNDGCPDTDNDKDEIPDVEDRCPNEAETYNNVQDDDGCPDEELGDKDDDGITDDVDRCPYDAEDFDGDREDDGRPDEGRVVVEKTNIKINDTIYFDTGKDTIERSFDLLDEIASVINANPQLKKIRIEGHTDSVGGDPNNLRPSQARAAAVLKYLVNKGIEDGRPSPGLRRDGPHRQQRHRGGSRREPPGGVPHRQGLRGGAARPRWGPRGAAPGRRWPWLGLTSAQAVLLAGTGGHSGCPAAGRRRLAAVGAVHGLLEEGPLHLVDLDALIGEEEGGVVPGRAGGRPAADPAGAGPTR